jgi:hypothetical protein
LVAPHSAAALSARKEFKNAGLVLDPPGAQRAAISLAKAFTRCESGDAVCPTGTTPTSLLALASSNSTGTTLPNGQLHPTMSKRLVYVFQWDTQPCVRVGGPAGAARAEQSCTYLNLVDAKTGEVVYTAVSPTP